MTNMVGRELYTAPGHFACECPNLSAQSRSDMDLNKRHSMKTRNRHDSVNDKQMAGIDLKSMIRRNLRDFDLNSMIRRNLRDFVNDMESFNRTVVVARDANCDNMMVSKMIWYLILITIMICHGLALIQMN